MSGLFNVGSRALLSEWNQALDGRSFRMIGGDEVLGFPIHPGPAFFIPHRDHIHRVFLIVVEEHEADRQRVRESLADRHE